MFKKVLPKMLLVVAFGGSTGVIPDLAHAEEPLCIGSDLAKANAALDEAKAALDKAVAAIDAGTASDLNRLLIWFGAKSSADAKFVREKLVTSRVYADGATFRCAVNTDVTIGDVYAYVRPDKSFAIVLGAFFFNAPDTGFNSKRGVLVHEVSHFILAGATKDTVYGVAEAKKLAKASPAAARNTADNYEYFVEATVFGF